MKSRRILAALLVVVVSLACQFATDLLAEPPATWTPQPIVPSSTPTETSTPKPTPNRTATAQAVATDDANAALEIAEPDLKMLGYNVNSGRLAWANFEEIRLQSSGGGIYDPLDENLILRDFILGVDVTWDSESGFAGCGIIFHADNNFERGERAAFYTIRLSGFPGWFVALINSGYFRGILSGSVRSSGAIHQESDSTNHYVLVSRGSTVVAYANGTKLGISTLNERRYKGQFAFFSWTDAGIVSCKFNNGWIMELPQK